jgi:hypothetical protein
MQTKGTSEQAGSPVRGAIPGPERAEPEAERQLAAAVERHQELVGSIREPRSESGQHVAVKAVGRAVQLVVFALRHAADTGVPRERLVHLSGWEPELVDEALAGAPEPSLVARLAPAGLDTAEVAEAAAGIEATTRLQDLTRRILADVGDAAWSPTPADLVDLHGRLDVAWRSWREDVGRGRP